MNEVFDSSDGGDEDDREAPSLTDAIDFVASGPPSPNEGLHTPRENTSSQPWWQVPVVQRSLAFVSRLLVGQTGHRPDIPLQIQHFTHIPQRTRRLNHHNRLASGSDAHHPVDAIDYDSAEEDDDLMIDLTGAVHCYRRTPNEYYGNIVAAALASRGVENPVTGTELREAGGVPFLVKAILACGCLDLRDPLTELEVQRNIDACIFPEHERFNGRVNPVHYEFLRCLFAVPTAYVNGTQRALLQRSGFEFVKLLHDFPHVERFIPPPRVLSWENLMEITHRLDLPIMLVSLSLTLLGVASMAYVLWYWFSAEDNQGFAVWTIVTFLGGTIVDLIATAIVLHTKSDSSIYEDLTIEFPTVYAKLFPVVPMYDILLAMNGIRLSCSTSDCFILRHDVFAAFDVSRWINVLSVSLPQLLLQSYLFFWNGDSSKSIFNGYRMLVGACVSLIFLSFPLYLRMVTSGNSVTSTGFACFGDSSLKMMERGQGFPRMLTYTLLYVFEINVFFLIVAVLNVKQCSTNMIVWISIASVIVLSTGVMFIYTLLSSKSMVRAAKWAIPPIACQIAFTIFVASAPSQVDSGTGECKVFFLLSGANVAAGYASWGTLCFILGLWGLKKLWMMYNDDRRQAQSNSGMAPF